jgi:hypothetical protein
MLILLLWQNASMHGWSYWEINGGQIATIINLMTEYLFKTYELRKITINMQIQGLKKSGP